MTSISKLKKFEHLKNLLETASSLAYELELDTVQEQIEVIENELDDLDTDQFKHKTY